MRDLDLVAGEVRICRAYDERETRVKVPKTDEGGRVVTIPSTLLPLLERIARERDAADLVAPIIAATPESLGNSKRSRATLFRGFLHTAGIRREELFAHDRDAPADRLPLDPRHGHHMALPRRAPRGGRPA